MSVCVSSALTALGGMSISHMPLASTMMQTLSHPIMPPSIMPSNSLQASMDPQSSQQVQQMHQSSSSEMSDHPNPDMLLALIARNKALEDVGSQGSRSDGGIFRDCELNNRLLNNQLNLPQPQALPGTDVGVPYYFIGDNAFKLTKHMLRPFPGEKLSNKQKHFNDVLSSARKTSEDSFGRIYRKFRIFGTDIEAKPDCADYYILASCAPHNFIQIEDRGFPYYGRSDAKFNNTEVYGPNWSKDTENMDEGLKCREIVMEYLFLNQNS